MKKAEKSKRGRRKKGGKLTLLVALVALYVIVNILAGSRGGVSTMPVRHGAEEETLRAEGYIFRDQTVIYAPASGFLYAEVREDERVKSGEAVMSVYKSEINTQASNRLKQIDEEIEKLNRNVRKADVFSNDAARIEQDISHLVKQVTHLAAKSSASGISEIRGEIDSLIEKKRIISGEIEPSSGNAEELESLKAEKAKIEQENSVERTIVHSPKAGAFTARIDGMEELLSLERLNDVSHEYIKELASHKINAETAATVNEGEAVGKIVGNYIWSAAVLVSAEDAENINEGDTVGIRFVSVGGDAVDGTVSRVSGEKDGEVVVVVSTNKYISSVYSTSKAELELVFGTYEGYKIPSDSIRMVNGEKGVYVIRSGIARFIPVNVIYSGEEWIIVSEKKSEGAEKYLKIYDELIVSGKNLYDGKEVR